MDTFCNSNKFNSFFLSSLLTIFSISAITPPPAYAFEVNLGNINFAIKIEKLVEKLKKYKDRLDSSKVIDTMLELREEIEGYTGKKIDLKSELNKIEKEIKKNTGLSSKEFKNVKEFILAKEKKSKHRAMVMLAYMEDNLGVSFQEYEVLYNTAREKDKVEQPFEVSPTMAIGCVLVLSGALLGILSIEFPILITAAEWSTGTGLIMIADDLTAQGVNKKG